MTEIILRELNSGDIDWMTSAGRKLEIAPGDRLLAGYTHSDRVYLILEGQFKLVLPESNRSQPAMIPYTSGDVVGFSFLSSSDVKIVLQALEKSLVLAIDSPILIEKLQQDPGFSARFHRAIAMLLSRKRWQIASSLLEVTTAKPNLAVESSSETRIETNLETTESRLLLFSCLHDSDICWMTRVGQVKPLKANETYLQEGQPIETLDIVLEGNLWMLIGEGRQNALPLAFGLSHSNQPRKVAQAFPGDILGITAFLDRTPNLYLLQAMQETRLLSIPIDSLMPKLQTDSGFADRFYAALANLMAERLGQVMNYLSLQTYEPGCSLCDNSEYEGELDMEALQQLSVARTKFNWLQQQLGVKDRT